MHKESFNVLNELAPKQWIPIHIGGIDLTITNTVVTMFLAVGLAALVLIIAARSAKLVPGRFQSAIELFLEFIKNDIILLMMGPDGLVWFPFLGALFFFIFFSNLLGLVPGLNTPTGRLAVPLTMAVIVFLIVHISGMIRHGTRKYFAGWVPHGVPAVIWPVVFVLEFISAFAKPFSLTIRLFANMMAGHVIIFVFLGMVIMLNTLFVFPASLFFAVVMMVLEILFSAIQAYVFTVLTAMYIGTAMNPQH